MIKIVVNTTRTMMIKIINFIWIVSVRQKDYATAAALLFILPENVAKIVLSDAETTKAAFKLFENSARIQERLLMTMPFDIYSEQLISLDHAKRVLIASHQRA